MSGPEKFPEVRNGIQGREGRPRTPAARVTSDVVIPVQRESAQLSVTVAPTAALIDAPAAGLAQARALAADHDRTRALDDATHWALRARDGDPAAQAAFVRATQSEVWRFTAALVDPDTADDLPQETYLRAFRALPAFEGRSSARTWLLGIARRACADHLRTVVRRRRLRRPADRSGAHRPPVPRPGRAARRRRPARAGCRPSGGARSCSPSCSACRTRRRRRWRGCRSAPSGPGSPGPAPNWSRRSARRADRLSRPVLRQLGLA